jgi:hypothetical protein
VSYYALTDTLQRNGRRRGRVPYLLGGKKRLCRELREERENDKEKAFFFAVFASWSFLAVSCETVFCFRVIRDIRG